MAKALLNVATIPAGRRRGVVYATTGNVTQVRSLAIPTQPKAAAAAAATTSVANLASLWGGLTPTQLASWVTGAGTITNAYALFTQLGQWAMTWGTPIYLSWPGPGSIGGVGLATLYCEENQGPVTLQLIYEGGLPPPVDLTFRVYWDSSAAFATPRPGYASPAPFGGTFTDFGYVYIGSFLANGSDGVTTYDVTDTVRAILGQIPAWAINDETTGLESGALWMTQVYVTNADGLLFDSSNPQPYASSGAFNPPA